MAASEATALITSAQDLIKAGDGAGALEEASKARSLSQESSDKSGEAVALVTMANALIKKGNLKNNWPLALEHATSAKMLFADLKDKKSEAISLHTMGGLQALLQQSEDAIATSKDATRLFQELGDRQLEASEMNATATWCLMADSYDAALQIGQEALAIFRELKCGGLYEAYALTLVYKALVAKDMTPQALRLARESAERFKMEKDKEALKVALELQVHAFFRQGDSRSAGRAAKELLGIYREAGNKAKEANLLRLVAQLYISEKRFDKAQQATDMAGAIFKEIGANHDAVLTFQLKVEAIFATNEYQAAMEAAQAQLQDCQAQQFEKGQVVVLLCMSALCKEMADLDQAYKHAEAALDIAREIGDQKAEVFTLQKMLDISIALEDYGAAFQSAQDAKAISAGLNDDRGEVGFLITLAKLYCRALFQTSNTGSGKNAVESAKDAVMVARRTYDGGLIGAALSVLAQCYMVTGRNSDAQKAAAEAKDSYGGVEDYKGKAGAVMLSASAALLNQDTEKATALFNEGIKCAREANDSAGIAYALGMLEVIKNRAFAAAAPMPNFGDSNMGQVQTYQPKKQEIGQYVAAGQVVDPALFATTIADITQAILNNPEDEVDLDTPLMAAGITSQASVALRNAIAETIPGTRLPFTLVFDFPSINAIADNLAEQVRG